MILCIKFNILLFLPTIQLYPKLFKYLPKQQYLKWLHGTLSYEVYVLKYDYTFW